MAVYYFYGAFPESFKTWKNGDKTQPLIDPDNGIVAMWFGGRYRIRNQYGSWATLGNNHYAPNYSSYFVELQSSNEDWRSDVYLDLVLDKQMPPDVQIYVVMPAADKYREIQSLARRQQSQWAKAIKARADGRCYLTGSMLALEAAHIKPFCICSNEDAISLDNGVCLTATVHRLFDSISTVTDIPRVDPLYNLIDLKKMEELITRRDEMNG
ncbi:HNH endonuclease [Sodalis sp. RH20]|uniref:HNH endonuclease n=1 Tax=unclassified Sodalis (in: enterobacteria) TaxID=2636512 RepID=UPI0039B667B8